MVKKILCSAALLAPLMLLFAGLASAQGQFVYTNDDIGFAPNTVSGFSVASNGTLTLISGSPFLTGGTGNGGGFFATNRTRAGIVGNCLFASNTGSNDVSAFTIDTTTGVLALVAGSPFPTGGLGDGLGIAVAPTPNGMFLITANAGSINASVFSVAAGCALTPIAGSPFPLMLTPDGIKVTQNGSFLAVAEGSQYEMLSIASDGSLTSIGGFPITGGNFGAGVDSNCASDLLYGGEANGTGTIVDGYAIASNGDLTPVKGSPFEVTSGVNSNVVLLGAKPGTKPVKTSKLLYVSNQFSNGFAGSITVFSVSSKGSLSLVKGSPFPMNSGSFLPSGMDTSPDGSLLYVANPSNEVSVFSVSSKGVPTEVAGSPFSTGQPGGLLSLAAFPSRACK